jgi:hypothetical protein
MEKIHVTSQSQSDAQLTLSETATREDDEPDTELSELVESFQKLQKKMPGTAWIETGPTAKETLDYVGREIENLKGKQTTIQEHIEVKNKEIRSLRDTLLVVNGALQGLQHINHFMSEKGDDDKSSSLTSGDAGAGGTASI